MMNKGQVQEAVCLQGVCAKGVLHFKFNTAVTCGRGDVVDDLVCLFHATKFLCITVNDGARCISWRRRVELERAKGDIDIEFDTFGSKV